jgi:hypothetical protein
VTVPVVIDLVQLIPTDIMAAGAERNAKFALANGFDLSARASSLPTSDTPVSCPVSGLYKILPEKSVAHFLLTNYSNCGYYNQEGREVS